MKRSSKAHSIGCFAKNFYGFAKQIFFTPKNAQNPGILHPDLRFRKAESWRIDWKIRDFSIANLCLRPKYRRLRERHSYENEIL